MAKQSKNLNLLQELIEKKHIIINVNSEKTAKAAWNKMYDCVKELSVMLFMNLDNITDYCFAGKEYGPSMYGSFNEFKKIYKILADNGIIATPHKTCLSIDNYKSEIIWYKDNCSPEECAVLHPNYTIKIGGDRFGNNAPYIIEWVPKDVTNTSKRNTAALHLEKVREVCKKIGVLYNCPNNCWEFKTYKKVTEYDYQIAISNCEAIINGKETIPPCTEKQATWVAKLMNIDIEKARKLNKQQAGEFLNYKFNSQGFYNEEECKKVEDFYIEIINNI